MTESRDRATILALREAFVAGAEYQHCVVAKKAEDDELAGVRHRVLYDRENNRDEAKRRYPLTVTRPRVVVDEWERVEWKSDGCNLYWTLDRSDWHRYPEKISGILAWPNAERIAIWSDLISNPTETVDADE